MNQHSAAARELRFAYGRTEVFSGLNLRVPSGVTGLLGPNGAGKTTLLNLFATLAKPQGGSVEVLGTNPADREGRQQIRRRIGFMPQRFGVIGSFTVRESVEYAAWLHGAGSKSCEKLAADALTLVDLSERAGTKVRKLSGGMRQRLGIAQSLAHQPDLLILDEPTVGLDPVQRMSFRELLRRAGERGSVIISSHMVDDIEQACDWVVVLKKGETIFTGSPTELANVGAASAQGGPLGSPIERGYAALVTMEET